MIISPWQVRFPRFGSAAAGAPALTTVFLANFNGVDAATSYSSETPVSVASFVESELDTAQKYFGSASVKMTVTTGAAVEFATFLDNGSDFLVDTGESWTFEAFVRPGTGGGILDFSLWDDGGSGNSEMAIQLRKDISTVSLAATDDTMASVVSTDVTSITMADDTWYHLAFSYDRAAFQFYWNGSRIANVAAVNKDLFITDVNLSQGAATWWVDSIRITRGVRYTGASLTIPVSELA